MVHYANDDRRPSFNLALEHVILARANAPAFLLWRNAPAVILGRNQDPAAEVDWTEARRLGVPVFRRRSGGGAVYHDLGTVNFSFILPASFPAAEALERMVGILGLPAAATERNDVLADGRKIAGTAQYLSGARRLFHGCLLYDTDLARLARLLRPHPGKLRRHGVASVRARVANLRDLLGMTLSPAEFFAELRARAARAFAGPPSEVPLPWREEAEKLAATPPFRELALRAIPQG
jgi:lipoate-protein ligase A